MRFAIAALAAVALASGADASQFNSALFSEEVPTEMMMQDMFTSYMKQFNKVYSHEEFFARYNQFKSNVERIRVHNAFSNETYTRGINQFTDLSTEEFKAKYLGYKASSRAQGAAEEHEIVGAAPTKQDWRTQNAVTGVKDQGQCGSCWAFSTTGSLEGAWVLQGKHSLTSFSEQQLVSCDKTTDQGCNGGLMDSAFTWIEKNGGICTEADYPYTSGGGVRGTCKTTCSEVGQVTGYKDITHTSTSETTTLLNAVGTVGPVSIAVEADQAAWQDYSSGVITSKCGTNLDHGVLIVGYDTTASPAYWIVKNSWGASWGEKGYIRLGYGSNICGLALQPSYPTV